MDNRIWGTILIVTVVMVIIQAIRCHRRHVDLDFAGLAATLAGAVGLVIGPLLFASSYFDQLLPKLGNLKGYLAASGIIIWGVAYNTARKALKQPVIVQSESEHRQHED